MSCHITLGITFLVVVALSAPLLAAADPDFTPPDGWPALFKRPATSTASVARAAVPIPHDADPAFVDALLDGDLAIGGKRVQAEPVAFAPGGKQVRRVVMRWIDDNMQPNLASNIAAAGTDRENAGWDWSYEFLEGSPGPVQWYIRLKEGSLAETEYEMHQLNLTHGSKKLGLRLGLRWNDRIYWWQFVRADFLKRGPVYDVLRVGGPIYNEYNTLQSDMYLILYANGVIEAYTHFQNHQREGVATDNWGVPVIAFDIPGAPEVNYELKGDQALFDLGPYKIDLDQSVGFVSPDKPGAIKKEDGVIVYQPWLDQEIWGELLVDGDDVPDHRIVHKAGEGKELASTSRGEADEFWVAKLGEHYIPKGMARTVRFSFSLGDAPASVARYQAPASWYGMTGAIPTLGYLPVEWWAIPRALEVGRENYFVQHPRHPVFEYGCYGGNSDGTHGGASLMLGNATNSTDFTEHALPSAYWWADIAIDHSDFTVHEVPKYSWQWIVQPYMRWLELVYVYWETGDPYLLQTAQFTSDAFYRFFWTNRPHRFVGRDTLACADMLALFQATGQTMYLDRVREILAEARRSYDQTDVYWPGHQSGSGSNGVARQPDWNYIPMLLARLNAQLIEAAEGALTEEEEADAYHFLKDMVQLVTEKNVEGGWDFRRTSLSYTVLSRLADRYPDEATMWLTTQRDWNAATEMPDRHDGGKAYCWMSGAVRHDAFAWCATWENGVLHLRPRHVLLSDPRAPKTAVVHTPAGAVTLRYRSGKITPKERIDFPIMVHD